MKVCHVTRLSCANWPVQGDKRIYHLSSGNEQLTQLTHASDCLASWRLPLDLTRVVLRSGLGATYPNQLAF